MKFFKNKKGIFSFIVGFICCGGFLLIQALTWNVNLIANHGLNMAVSAYYTILFSFGSLGCVVGLVVGVLGLKDKNAKTKAFPLFNLLGIFLTLFFIFITVWQLRLNWEKYFFILLLLLQQIIFWVILISVPGFLIWSLFVWKPKSKTENTLKRILDFILVLLIAVFCLYIALMVHFGTKV